MNRLKNMRRLRNFSIVFALSLFMGSAYAFTAGDLNFSGTLRIHAQVQQNWVILANYEISSATSPSVVIGQCPLNPGMILHIGNSESQLYRQRAAYMLEFLPCAQVGDAGRIYFDIENRHPTRSAQLTRTASTGANQTPFASSATSTSVASMHYRNVGNFVLRITDMGRYGAPMNDEHIFIIPPSSTIRIFYEFQLVEIHGNVDAYGIGITNDETGHFVQQSYNVQLSWTLE